MQTIMDMLMHLVLAAAVDPVAALAVIHLVASVTAAFTAGDAAPADCISTATLPSYCICIPTRRVRMHIVLPHILACLADFLVCDCSDSSVCLSLHRSGGLGNGAAANHGSAAAKRRRDALVSFGCYG